MSQPRHDYDEIDTFMDAMIGQETTPCEIRLPEKHRADLERAVKWARFEPEKAFLHVLSHYAEEPLRTLAQMALLRALNDS